MAYGEMEEEALKWAAQSAFGLKPTSIPANIVITPLRLQRLFRICQPSGMVTR